MKEDPAKIETHKTTKDVKKVMKEFLSDDLYAPIEPHLRQLTEEEQTKRKEIQKKQHEDMLLSEERFQKAAARLQAEYDNRD